MTVSQQDELVARQAQALLSRLPRAALAALLFALVTGAWLAFFTFVPFDFTPPRPR